nr:unnamed protein product [Digitaria exilis]
MEVYKQTFNKMGGYIVNTERLKEKHAAYLKVSRLEEYFHELSLYEEKIFLKRYELRERLQRNILRQAAEEDCNNNERNFDNMEGNPDGLDLTVKSFSTQCGVSACSTDKSDITANTLELRQSLKDILRNKQDLIKSGACKHDTIRLGLAGWKSRFYREKFDVERYNEVGKLKDDMVQKYLEGLCWVLQYYFAEVPSWSWYYHFYYAPFASDLKGLSQFKISFTMDKPLKPFDQLMAVLPQERHVDHSLYLQIDTHGKRFLWQGIAKLPFIDEKMLVSATKTVENELKVHEMSRNTVRQDKIFMRNSKTLAKSAASVQISDCSSKRLSLDPSTSELGGWLLPVDNIGTSCAFYRSPISHLEDIRNDQTVSFLFFNPEPVKIIPRLLEHVEKPEKTVTEADISTRPLWHTYQGSRPPTTITATAEPQPRISGFGRGRGRAMAETPQWRGTNGRGFHGPDTAQSRGSSGANTFWPGGRACAGRGQYGGTIQRQQQAWRPVGSWARGDGGENGRGHGGSAQPRAW